ncbi:YceD family protein [Desulfurivibrio sp. C05AmB]|uniref:YceD family protein n=1 Tax=Desulfurivibrio sp. C05AmB TaxID=3374371 RepID=UPI00376EA157
MLIRFDKIPPQGLAFEIVDQSWFPGHELKHHGTPRAQVTLDRDGERVIMAGSLEATVELVCDRCLESYRWPLSSRFSLNLEVAPAIAEEQAGGEREHSCRVEEMDTVYLTEDLVDVTDLLAQQLYLSLPLKHLCREECRGLCPGCGADLNRGVCRCPKEAGSSPFAVLRNWKSS